MQHVGFATQIIASIDHVLSGDNVLTVIEPEACKVFGYTIGTAFAVLPLTVTLMSADGSIIYRTFLLDAAVPTSIVGIIPFVADKGLAWKATGAGSFSVLVYASFFLSQHGS